MQPEMEKFLNLKVLPGRLTADQTAWLLGFHVQKIPLLVAQGLLKPLGHPTSHAQKFFLTATLDGLRRDEEWFSKATDAIVVRGRNKNGRAHRNTLPKAELHVPEPRLSLSYKFPATSR